MMICAPLLKSPNCASHSTSDSGSSAPYPYSNPRHAYSESGELWISNDDFASSRCCNGTYFSFVRASSSTAWRCENVPRSVSCPVSRIGVPSFNSDANASASAVPQSTSPLSLSDCWRLVNCETSFLFRSEEHTSELQSRSDLVCRL